MAPVADFPASLISTRRIATSATSARWVHGLWSAEDESMLKSAPSAASLVVCSTCRHSKDVRTDAGGQHGGTVFAQALEDALATHPCRDQIEIQSMPCLFACSSHCTVYIRSARRLGYMLGRFTPSHSDALALLDYLAEYLKTADGVVPYACWPGGVKGHFLVRVPPDGFVWDPAAQASMESSTPASPSTSMASLTLPAASSAT
jgi:predicted metal-binding protein